jgi:NAD(P)-dependent dehydrogenase (short-subunit alcohol dehydrogenase family)
VRVPEKDIRILNVSSDVYRSTPKGGLLLDQVKTPLAEINTMARYGQSKLANIYFTQSYANRYPNIKSVALQPNLIGRNFWVGWLRIQSWLLSLAN